MDIYQLILKSCYSKLTTDEQAVLDAWLSEKGHTRLYGRIADTLRRHDAVGFLATIDTEQALLRAKGRRRANFRLRVAAVASIAAAVLAAVLWWAVPHSQTDNHPSELAQTTLTLSTGEVIQLGDSVSEHRSPADGVKLTSDGLEVQGGQTPSPVLNRLDVPVGRQCHLVLPDGTHVWVNARSVLKFPSSFAGLAERVVELTGEAYFEVAHDKSHPFSVIGGGQRVTATGTAFGIYAYPNEESRTTLCEGGVRVDIGSGKTVDLVPGEQLWLHADGEVEVVQVDVEVYRGWMQGVYRFDNVDLHEVLRTLSRWYDIRRVDFEEAVPAGKKFSGKLRKDDGLETILKVLELGTDCDIELHDGVLSVRAGNGE